MKNYIVKIEDGKPIIYGDVGDENDGTAPTYIFETEESYDAALADGLIPVGALIVKTYDAVEMAGGPFDAALSEESENAVQNKIIAAQVARLDEAIADAVALRASLTGFGMGKITPVDVTDITQDDGTVCGGFEKNPAVVGSLAYKIENINSALYSGNVQNSITLPAAMTGNNYVELCRTQEIPDKGVYLAYYHININIENGVLYQIRQIDSNGSVIKNEAIFAGKSGTEVINISSRARSVSLYARNISSSSVVYEPSANSKIAAMRLR